MPIPDIGPVSFGAIRNEFGGTGAVSLSQYYRGGGRVPDDVFCHNNTIPANGPINFDGFRGTTNGNTFLTYSTPGTYTSSLPLGTLRTQVNVIGGGGGGAGRRYSFFGTYSLAAGGGAGGYCLATQFAIQRNGESLRIVVGGGGSGLVNNVSGTFAQAGSGEQSRVEVLSVVGSVVRSTAAGGATGGILNSNINSGGTGGTGGTGCTRNGGNGGRLGNQGVNTVGIAGGTVDSDGVGGGAGGSASTAPVGNAGSAGRVRIRI